LARTFWVAHEQFSASASARRLLGERFVTAYASIKDIEYQNYLGEIGAWERRFLLPQA
jgi:glutamine synthetase